MSKIRNWTVLVLVTLVVGQAVQAQPVADVQNLRSWGPQAKGTVIGAGAGAAAGAIINKRNRAVGAVVGGVVGGAAGYAIGKNGRRWSPQAKGTAIGAGAGAAAGAIINKRNRAVGGVIGGVAGGAAGYAIGKRIDNKRKAREAARLAQARQEAAEREAAARAAAAEPQVELASGSMNRTYSVATPKRATATRTAPAQPGNAARPADLYAANATPVPYALPLGFLPNESYGDPSTPYPTSEYRRKSW